MTHNEEKYPNPSQFLPERFLDDDGNLNEDTVGIVFGFGRRFVTIVYLFHLALIVLVVVQNLRWATSCRCLFMDSYVLHAC
jgi:hypothetical protein